VPGPAPLTDKRDHYLRLVSQGVSNSEACRTVGVNRKTGHRWRYGRTTTDRIGRSRTYEPITDSQTSISARFLSEDERVTIADGILAGHTVRAIAANLGRSPSTISREIRRNQDPKSGIYHPHRAQLRTAGRRARPKAGKLALNDELREFVQDHLDQHWSPEQISLALPAVFADRPEMRAVHETIYQAIYVQSRGQLRRDLARKLRTGRARRQPRRRVEQRTTRFIDPGVLISERPSDVLCRLVAGHWEGDLITGRNNQSAIATLVERTSRYTLLVHLPDDHGAEQVRDALIAAFATIPPHLARSLTWDQGCEMARHNEFTATTGIPVFFCEPASPWQRGSNENTNGLLRQYLPRTVSMRDYSQDDFDAIADQLNTRPRQTLGFKTPSEALAEVLR
jgi:IS30 family transposase